MQRTQFQTTTQGIDRESLPMRLFEKAKKFGIWNPSEIDFEQDKADWANFDDTEREFILHVVSLFQGGEEAVTLDLLPLIMTIAKEGRLEEEMFLTTFLWEEAKHVDFFGRFLTTVAPDHGDLTRFANPAYDLLFHDKLPNALQALHSDASPKAQIIASSTYNMIVEGVLAETGYHGLFTALEAKNQLPGLRQGIYRLKQDESRHIAYGLYLLSRLIQADPELYDVADATMNELLPLAMGVINGLFSGYDPVPFGLDLNTFSMYALGQYQARIGRLQAARTATIDDLRLTSDD